MNNYIKNSNPYPPTLPKIMRKTPKKLKYEEVPKDVKEHRGR